MQYGHAMMQYLPTGGFEWVHLDTTSPEYWTQFINKQKDEQEKGYFVQVDLHYPKELHDKHDAYPLAPEHVEIKEGMLSDHQRKLAKAQWSMNGVGTRNFWQQWRRVLINGRLRFIY